LRHAAALRQVELQFIKVVRVSLLDKHFLNEHYCETVLVYIDEKKLKNDEYLNVNSTKPGKDI